MRKLLYILFFLILLAEVIAAIVYAVGGAVDREALLWGLVALLALGGTQKLLGVFFPEESQQFNTTFHKPRSNLLVFAGGILGGAFIIIFVVLIVMRFL